MDKLVSGAFDFLEQLREIALEYGDTTENFSWGSYVFSRELKGRNFVYATTYPDRLDVTFKVPVGQRETALELPFVTLHKSMGYKGWLLAPITQQAELEQILPWVRVSYELNKPFRTTADCMAGEIPELIDFLAEIRQIAHTYGDIEEYFPFGERAFRSRKGKIFLYTEEHGSCLYVSVRLPFGEHGYALSLPFVEVPKYIGHQNWVGVKVRNREELETLLPWLPISFEMNNPPKKGKRKTE